MFELILWCISKIYEETKASFNRSGEEYEGIMAEPVESLISLLGLDTNTAEEEMPCMS